MSVIWRKIWFDLWHNKTRTLLAVLSIAVGVFAVGAIFGMSDLLITNMDLSQQSVIPPHISVSLDGLVDRKTILNLRSVPGVEDVEPYNEVSVQYKLHPQDPWRQGVIEMKGDYIHQKFELVQLRQGQWPRKNEVSVERMAAQFLNVGIGDSIIFKIGKQQRAFPVTGLIRHPFVPPPQFEDLAFFFMNGQTDWSISGFPRISMIVSTCALRPIALITPKRWRLQSRINLQNKISVWQPSFIKIQTSTGVVPSWMASRLCKNCSL